MKIKNNLTSLLLVIVLLFGMIPSHALAMDPDSGSPNDNTVVMDENDTKDDTQQPGDEDISEDDTQNSSQEAPVPEETEPTVEAPAPERAPAASNDLPTDQGELGETLDGDYAYLAEVKMVEDDTTESGFSIRTGTAPWDDDDEAGNDSSDLNNTLRSFDTAQYTFEFTTYTRKDSPYATYKNGNLYFEFVLPGTSDEIRFEDTEMAWLKAKNATYVIHETQVDGVTSQVLQGVVLLTPGEANPQAIGNTDQSLNVIFRALAMNNGQEIKPRFTMWLEGNDIGSDYSGWGTSEKDPVTGTHSTCATHSEEEIHTLDATPITITAAPRYNLQLANGSTAQNSFVDTFDFSTGNDNAIDKDAGTVRGRAFSLGMAISVNGKEGQGLRGVELPKDNSTVTFDLNLSSSFTYNDDDGKTHNISIDNQNNGDYSILIWTFDDNNEKAIKADGREIRHTGSNAATYYLPLNKKKTNQKYLSCFDGGSWSAVREGDTLHVTVEGMRVDTSQVSNFPYSVVGNNQNNYNYYNPNVVQNYWEIDTAYLSTGALWVVQPFNDRDGNYVADKYAPGTFNLTASDSKLVMETASGETITNDQQVKKNDDKKSSGLALVRLGSMAQHVVYTKPDTAVYNNALTPGSYTNGQDWIMAGSPLALQVWIANDSAEGEYRFVGSDNLVKFDDTFFEPNGEYRFQSYKTDYAKVLFAAKPDGSGWDHKGLKPDQDGYDEEMINATPDDLVFYESLDALQAAGKTCIGAMVEYRVLMNDGGQNHTHFFLQGTCKTTAQGGQVYMISPYARIWRVADVAKAQNIPASDLLETLSSQSDAENYGLLCQYIPSKADPNTAKKYSEYPNASYVNGGRDGTSDYSNDIRGYKKPYYNSDGYVSRSEGIYFGDSCLVVSHTTRIGITPAQQTPSGAKEGYDIDTNQRTADFVVTPQIRRNESLGHDTDVKVTDDVTVTLDLPKSLTYIEGSLYIGGTYNQVGEGQQGNITGGTQLKENDTVSYTDSQGQTHDVKLELVNEGTDSHLAVTVYGVEVTGASVQDLPLLHFSTTIGTPGKDSTDVQNNDSAKIRTEIYSNYDRRIRSIEFQNAAETGIRVSKLRASTLSKYADQAVVEAGEPISFTMNIGNNSSNPEDIVAIDNLPYGGNSVFHGSMYLSEFRVANAENIDTSNLHFYYTMEESERGNVSKDYMDAATDFASDKNWTELSFDSSTGVVTLPEKTLPASIAIVGSLEGMQNLQLHSTFDLPKSEAGDYLVNTLSKAQLSSTARSRVVSRSLEGLTWIDTNQDGIQNDGTDLQSGVKVTLLRKDEETDAYEEVASVMTGQQWDRLGAAATDYEEGRYRFSNLLGGTYKVVFTSGDFDIQNYSASPVNQGTNDDIDSDATGSYNGQGLLQQAEIADIVMPSTADLQYGSYVMRHQDGGFYLTETEFTAQKQWSDEENKYEKRSDSVTVQLYADGVAVEDKTAVLNEENNWSSVFEHLPKYNETTHAEIAYSVKEDAVAGYSANYSEVENGRQTVTNTMVKEESGSASFQVKKVREGDETIVVPGAVFALADGNGNVVQTATTDASGIATFTFTFGDETEKASLVLSEQSAPAGYTKTTDTWTVNFKRDQTPTITLNQDRNLFEIIWNWIIGMQNDNNYKDGVLTVSNPYSTSPKTLTLEGLKDLSGRDLNDGEFTFTVKEGEDVVATGSNDVDGKITFSDIEFNLEDVGTHTFTITEDAGDKGGVDYSKESYTVTVVVSDNKDGTLSVAPTYPEDGLVFHNEYSAAEAIVTLTANKTLEGKELTAGMFEFVIKNASEEVVASAANDANGNIAFPELRFDEVGTYSYTISETKGNVEGITYDDTIYKVNIVVTDDGEGKLIASIETDAKNVVFHNKYTPNTPDTTVTKDSNSPNTGDTNHVFPWSIVLILSLATLITLLARRLKNNF